MGTPFLSLTGIVVVGADDLHLPSAFSAAPVTHLNGLYLPPPILPPRQPVQREVSFSDSEDETSSSDAASLASTTDTDEVKPM